MKGQEFLRAYQEAFAQLRAEVEAFPSDESLWLEHHGISNAAGTLVLHLVGNTRWFIGSVLGTTGYVRDRPQEFSERHLSREEVLRRLQEAERDVVETLQHLSDGEINNTYPLDTFGVRSTANVLVHLLRHFAYHVGQLNYYRRMSS
ncbi:MAG TPA: DinB superfamily protein [Bacteroidetes bacterium]|nr:DinB superfamily protein [Bacteroidota bacterium]HRK05000.1 DinB family protein [Chlorobiota bacterium]